MGEVTEIVLPGTDVRFIHPSLIFSLDSSCAILWTADLSSLLRHKPLNRRNSAPSSLGFLLTSALVAIFRDERGRALREPWFPYRKATVVILDHCGFRPMFLGCSQTIWAHSHVL